MKVIGLCGGSGSGKGTVSRIFLEYGIPSIDTDAVYHGLTEKSSPCLDALVSSFGEDILDCKGALDRKKLSQTVFHGENSTKRREMLNRISHKFVLEETRKILQKNEKSGIPATLVDAPLLFESGFDKECSAVIAVVADKDIRLSRIISRDGISEERARARIASQLSDEYLIGRADYTIVNNGSVTELRAAVRELAEKILNQ